MSEKVFAKLEDSLSFGDSWSIYNEDGVKIGSVSVTIKSSANSKNAEVVFKNEKGELIVRIPATLGSLIDKRLVGDLVKQAVKHGMPDVDVIATY
jgi:hypothetical protein